MFVNGSMIKAEPAFIENECVIWICRKIHRKQTRKGNLVRFYSSKVWKTLNRWTNESFWVILLMFYMMYSHKLYRAIKFWSPFTNINTKAKTAFSIIIVYYVWRSARISLYWWHNILFEYWCRMKLDRLLNFIIFFLCY